jgi:HAD superfamily hydrolase (TIGR01549 family)
MDGTLLESRRSIRETMNTVLAERGLSTFTREELDAQIGRPLRDILAVKTPDPAAIEAMTHRYREAYNESGWVTAHVFDGLEDLVRDLRSRGVRQGIVTSKGQRETEILLRDLGLHGLFDPIVGDDDRRPLKPDPAPVLEACRLAGVPPSDAVMIGDTRFDVGAGLGAGASVIGVLWGIQDEATLRAAGCTVLVSTVSELERLLR